MIRRFCVLAMALVIGACGSSASDNSATPSTGAATNPPPSSAAVTTTPLTTTVPTTVAPASTPPTTAAPTTSPPTTAAAVLRVLVTNDDGYGAPGIDAVVEALRAQPNTDVVVVAPKENQSGTGQKATPDPLVSTQVTTASGYPAVAIAGFPADSVRWALDGGVAGPFDLVVSGINTGQNLGPFTQLSGTVGAAITAAKAGVPALATSQGLADRPDFAAGVAQTLAWIAAHRDALAGMGAIGAGATVTNLNTPTCLTGTVRGVVEAPVATTDGGRNLLGTSDCTSTVTDPADDVDAFNAGFAVLSPIALG